MPFSPLSPGLRRLARRVAIAALATLGGASGAHAAFAPGTTQGRTLTHDAVLRDYAVYAPFGYDGATAVPLVVDLHGAGSNAAEEQFISGWDAKANQRGFLVAYPNGLDNTWNGGICCDPSAANGVDDVGFVRAMVAAIQAEGNVDASRIYVTGLSNGGAMTHRLACEASDVFAAAAPLAFPVPYVDFPTECNPEREIPLLLWMGLTDVIVPYEDGPFGGAVDSYQAWRAKSSCGAAPEEEDVAFGGSHCLVDQSCAGGTQVGLCSIRGSDLAPPLDVFNGHLLYLNDDDIVIPDVVWNFFQTGSVVIAPTPLVGPVGGAAVAAVLAVVGFAALRRRSER